MIRSDRSLLRRHLGFNLIEMAVVLVVLGLLLGGLVTPLSTQYENARRNSSEAQLNEIREALLGFAARTGRLPCPASTGSAGLANPNTATTACNSANGFVPARTLDLNGSFDTNNLLLDPWLNPVRYSLTTAGAGAYSDSVTLTLTPDLQVCSQSACTGVIADSVVAVIFSLGEDGTVTTSPDQLENTDGDLIFVTRTLSEASGAEFDDQLVWISPNILAFQLVRAGRVN